MRVALILNPTAGSSPLARQKGAEGELEAELLQALQVQGIEPEVYYTTIDDPGKLIAKKLVDEGVELIVAVGGDGTIHSVAHGLIDSRSVLGIIPAGTMNNLARSLGIPEKLEEACAILAEGEARAIDVGMINEHTFLEVAGIGIEAALFPAAEEVKSRGLLSTIRGSVSGLYTLLKFHPPEVTLALDGERPRTYRAIEVTICNAPYYGPHLSVAPDILMNDGLLDVVLYTNFSKGEYIRHAISISQGKRTLTPKIIHRRVRSLRLSTSEAVNIQADGTVHGTTPVDVTVRPAALQVQVLRGAVPGLLAENRTPAKRKKQERKKTYV
jgi:YegS/Rv2252/BmrU family lipid kinase